MPLPRKKDAGGSGAPVLNILSAHVRLFDVEEHEEPYTVSRKSDGAHFELDPGFNCTVEVVDDNRDGSDNRIRFFESFRYKGDAESGWFNKENSKLGVLTKVVKPGYFEDETIPNLTAGDLEGFEMLCRIKPKKNPNTGAVVGSTIDWETMQPLPARKLAAGAAVADVDDENEFGDIAF